MSHRALPLAVLILLATYLAGCSKAVMPGSVSATAYPPTRPGPLRVGAARVDITPPPGVSTFGHGPDALAASGYWTRLYCKPFVLTTTSGQSTAIVPCDLAAVSVLLQRQVASKLRRLSPALDLPTTRLFISATHTHAGPAHYFESVAFGGITSTRYAGFDPAMVEFLASRIAKGIARAAAHQKAARLRWVRRAVWGLTRNRELDHHLANRKLPELDADLGPVPEHLSEVERHIDPALDVLQIETQPEPGAEAGIPLGAVAFFAMHPTVLLAHQRLLGGDVFAIATRIAERELRRVAAGRGQSAPDPIVAIVNTNEGDISPTWKEGTPRETRRLGQALGAEIWQNLADETPPWQAEMRLDSRYLEVELPRAPYWRGFTSAAARPGAPEQLCAAPMLGQAAGRGATDHESSLWTLQDSTPTSGEASRDDEGECHSPKVPMLGALQPLLLGPIGFPDVVPLGLVRLGKRWVAFTPAELTYAAGYALRRRIAQYAKPTDGEASRTIVAGLSNGYLLYVATPDEYALQGYEGASTLYGPGSLSLLKDRFSRLAAAMLGLSDKGIGIALPFEYETAAQRQRLPEVDPSASSSLQGTGIEGACRLGKSKNSGSCIWWKDGAPGLTGLTEAPWVRVLRRDGSPMTHCGVRLDDGPDGCDPQGTVDDRGAEFATRASTRDGDLWRWIAIFRPAPEFTPIDVDFDEAVLAVGPFQSAPLGTLKPCTPCEVRFCRGPTELPCDNAPPVALAPVCRLFGDQQD